MLSIAPLAGGPGYYLELANINYYMEGERGEPMPFWHGQAAAEFGLSGMAEKEHVERLCAGFDPHDPSKRLVRNAGKETRNPGHDFTFSAPKSLSCAWSVADPELSEPSRRSTGRQSKRPSRSSRRRWALPASGPTARSGFGARFSSPSSTTGPPEPKTSSSTRTPSSST